MSASRRTPTHPCAALRVRAGGGRCVGRAGVCGQRRWFGRRTRMARGRCGGSWRRRAPKRTRSRPHPRPTFPSSKAATPCAAPPTSSIQSLPGQTAASCSAPRAARGPHTSSLRTKDAPTTRGGIPPSRTPRAARGRRSSPLAGGAWTPTPTPTTRAACRAPKRGRASSGSRATWCPSSARSRGSTSPWGIAGTAWRACSSLRPRWRGTSAQASGTPRCLRVSVSLRSGWRGCGCRDCSRLPLCIPSATLYCGCPRRRGCARSTNESESRYAISIAELAHASPKPTDDGHSRHARTHRRHAPLGKPPNRGMEGCG
ncbi:hypothetical protein CC85DRAFT_330115 [Cutaneotrichosporon oleaginosum]|uniref:Uncharacterized protein n=1 Tax=Cutaneotrichosporon oleaginosum TaxID=879819 RepID=A0A0J0XGJ1_9TREE|nr:uncharacterized protein CC85DRAFT_330115 [Cutaneotrichosporon oleaginosum]KLT40183.1 hypothetical protein CC85DRAFT_330115 [Cutaneotrichosporon oleaginosum]